MKILRNKTLTVIASVVMLTMAVLMAGIQSVNAVVVELDTFCYVMVFPNPVGVNQQVIVTFQLDKVNPLAVGVTGGEHFKGFTVKITKPDGTTETKGPYEAWSMSGGFFYYTPTLEGNYTFQSSFPGQWANTTTYQRWYRPSTSDVLELTVQHEPIAPYPEVPLPTEYWTRPIYGENKGWWQVSDNWLMKGYDIMTRPFPGSPAFAPYTSAPNSAHMMWTRPLWFGGIVGGPYGDKVYYSGLSYEQPYEPLILNGRIIYTEHDPASTSNLIGTRCLDLYTGEEIWFLNKTVIDFAQLFDIENPNEHGLIAHLWSYSGPASNTTLTMYDAFTGTKILTIMNVTWGMGQSMYWGPAIFGPSGEILSYSLDTKRNRLIMWNSSGVIFTAFPWMGVAGDIYSPMVGAVLDGQTGIQWNVSIPAVPGVTGRTPERWLIGDDTFLAGFVDDTVYPYHYTHVAFPATLERLANGSYPVSIEPLWVQNRTNIYGQYERLSRNIQDGVYAQYDEPKAQLHGYDIKTGEELWVTTSPKGVGFGPLFTRNYIIAYGKIYTVGYDGYVRAYDIKDGSLVWESYFGSAGYETPYGTWPVYAGPTIADGKIYITNDDHSPDAIPWRGGKLWVFDTETGDGLWNISGWFRIPAVADGYLTACNSLDGQIYCFGKGPSTTTVSVSQDVITKGSTVLIKGTVTDQSPGQPGTPCVSKENMSAWMEYLHMQKTIPATVTGVPVQLLAMSSNGTVIEIGTATTNGYYGTFSYEWTPPDEDLYTVIATFNGDESYGSSSAATGLSVGAAPQAPPEAPAYTGIDLAIIAAVVVVAILVLYDIISVRKLRK